MNLSRVLFWSAKRVPDKPALIVNGHSYSYQHITQDVNRCSQSLRDHGIQGGDRVVILLPNSKEFIHYFFALANIEAIGVPLNISYTAYELSKIFSMCSPSAVICDQSFVQKILDADKSLFHNKLVIIHTQHEETLGVKDLDCKKLILFTDSSSLNSRSEINLFYLNTPNDAIATINYTYRDYGYPLGAITTHSNYIHGVERYYRSTGINHLDTIIMLHPISHIYSLVGCVITPFLLGATVVIPTKMSFENIINTINEHNVTIITAVPTFYILLIKYLKHHKVSMPSLRFGLSGGSILPSWVYSALKSKLGIELIQGYGLTETLPITCNPLDANLPSSVGVPGCKTEIKISHEDSRSTRFGEILVKSPTVTKGYFKQDAETKKVLKDGWFYTGDYGHIDKQGHLYYDGFKKKCAKVGGHLIDLNEVKNVALMHPYIVKADIMTKPDLLWGDHLEINLLTNQIGAEVISDKSMRIFLKKYLAPYKVPKVINIAIDSNKIGSMPLSFEKQIKRAMVI